MSRKKFLCLDCGIDTGKAGELYMLNDDVWFSIHPSREGMLCVGCIENRLDRKLTPEDFNGSFLNEPWFSIKSMRLLDRLGNA